MTNPYTYAIEGNALLRQSAWLERQADSRLDPPSAGADLGDAGDFEAWDVLALDLEPEFDELPAIA